MAHPDTLTIPTAAGAASPVSSRSPRRLAIATGVALSCASIYLSLRGTDLRQIGLTLLAANVWLALPLLVLQVLFYTLKAIRWRLLLMPVHRTSAARLAAPMMIGFMGNNLLPARLGELIRLHLGVRSMKISYSQVLATLVLERLFDFIAVLALFAAGAVALPNIPETLVSGGYLAGAASGVAAAATGAYVMWTGATLRVVRRATRRLPRIVADTIQRQLELGATGMGALRQPSLLAGIAAASLLQWFLMAGCIYLSFLAVGVDAPPAAALVVLAATVFGVMVPAAPGFVGTLHLAFVLALTPFDVDDNRAMAAAVFYHIIPYVFVIAAGAYYVRQMGVRLQAIEREARATRAEGTIRGLAI